MPTIDRILCPTDFSEQASHALTYALRLAEGLHAEVTLLHVCPSFPYLTPGEDYAPLADEERAIMESAQKELDSWVRKFSKTTTVPLKSRLDEGHAYKKINAAADELYAGLIVMGTHGRSGLSRMVMGSVAERTIRTSSRPVLTIPRAMAKTVQLSGAPSGGNIETPPHILLATDFSDPADRACELAKTLRESFGATVHVVHVILRPDDEVFGGDSHLHDKRFAAYELGLETTLEAFGRSFGPGPKVTTKLLKGKPVERILAAARATKADLVCVGTTGRGMVDRLLMGSTARALIRDSDVPVLITP
ncbi:MAG: universal stress protein [Polyangiales bacterium]